MALRSLTFLLLAALVLSMLPGRYVAADRLDTQSMAVPTGRTLKTIIKYKYNHPFLEFVKSYSGGGGSYSGGGGSYSGSAEGSAEASADTEASAGTAEGDASVETDGGGGSKGMSFKKSITFDKSG